MNPTASASGIISRLTRALNIRGDVAQDVKQLLPSISLLNIDSPEFWSGQPNGRLMAGAVGVAAVAGQQGFAHLANADPTVMAVVETVYLVNRGAGCIFNVGIGQIQGTYATAGVKSQRDDRQPVPGGTGLSAYTPVGGTAAAPPGVAGLAIDFAAAGVQKIDGPWVLTGQLSLEIVCSAANSAFAVGFMWRERRLLPSER